MGTASDQAVNDETAATGSNRLTEALHAGELLCWSLLARGGIAVLSLSRTLALLDRLPHRSRSPSRPVSLPPDRHVRFAGACLGRSLARSQYLRARGVPHSIVIGVTGGVAAFQAHAWVGPYETAPDGFVELRRVDR